MMNSYLNNRSQEVFFNGSTSERLNIGNQGCFQGTIMATLFYVIYVLDQPTVIHKRCEHINNYKNNENCKKNLSINYIDDNLSEVTTENWNNLENEAEIYLGDQKDYHIDNKLYFNEDKTIVVFNTQKKIY